MKHNFKIGDLVTIVNYTDNHWGNAGLKYYCDTKTPVRVVETEALYERYGSKASEMVRVELSDGPYWVNYTSLKFCKRIKQIKSWSLK